MTKSEQLLSGARRRIARESLRRTIEALRKQAQRKGPSPVKPEAGLPG